MDARAAAVDVRSSAPAFCPLCPVRLFLSRDSLSAQRGDGAASHLPPDSTQTVPPSARALFS